MGFFRSTCTALPGRSLLRDLQRLARGGMPFGHSVVGQIILERRLVLGTRVGATFCLEVGRVVKQERRDQAFQSFPCQLELSSFFLEITGSYP